VRSFIFCTHPQISLGRTNRGECGGRGIGEERKVYRFWWESPWKSVESEVRGIDEKMGSKWILGRLAGDVEWIQMAQYRDM
jgi:hypothetical protein